MNDWLDPARLILLVRDDVIKSYRVAGIAAAAVAAIVILQALITRPFETDTTVVYVAVFLGLAFIGAPIAASKAFGELYDKEKNAAYLLLPASSIEKVLARLFFIMLLVPLVILATVTATAWIVWVLKALAFGTLEDALSPLMLLDSLPVGPFVAQQSVFFLGAAWFRRHQFVKTGLAISLLCVGLFWFVVLVARIVVPDFGNDLTTIGFNPAGIIVRIVESYSSMGWLIGLLLYGALPVFCWVVAWLRLREAQVSHGV